MKTAVVVIIVLILCVLGLLGYVIWMKWSARHSKAKFAFYTVLTLSMIACSTLAALTSIDWSETINSLLTLTGLVKNSAALSSPSQLIKVIEKLAVMIVGIAAFRSVLKFSQRAVEVWEGPSTFNVMQLKDLGRSNHILALALAEISTKLSGQNDPEVDSRAMNWRQQISPAPEPVEFRVLARAAFLNHMTEAELEEGSWRQQSSAWLGRLFGPEMGKESELVLFVFSHKPTVEELSSRLKLLKPNDHCALYAVVEDLAQTGITTVQVENRTISVWGYRHLVRAGLPIPNYARQILKQFNEITVGGTQATLADTFVPARVKSATGQEDSLFDILENWISEPGRRHLAITGEYGQGKSTAMLHFCATWAAKFLNGEAENDRIPLLIELRGKTPGHVSPIEFLSQWGARYGLLADKIYSLIQSGQVILIFEGFDELRDAGLEFERHEHFNGLWRFAYPGTKIVLTGRPNFFIDQSERNSTLRIDKNVGAASNAYTEMYSFQMFNDKEVQSACRAYPRDVSDGIRKALHEHPDFREIVCRPSMLPVVATIWPEIQEAERSGQDITGSMLLERYLSAIYARKEAELEAERVQSSTPSLGSYLLLPRAVREALTLAVVWEMATADLRNTISRSQFDQVIEHVFDNVLRAMQSSEVRSPTLEEAKQLSARLASDNRRKFIEKVCTDVASAGLFVPDPVGGPSNLMFAHKQYFEYLIAKFVWIQLVMPKSEVVKSLGYSKYSATAPILVKTDAIMAFNRILGQNFSCFSQYELSLRFENFMTFLLEEAVSTSSVFEKAINSFLNDKTKRSLFSHFFGSRFSDIKKIELFSLPNYNFPLLSISSVLAFSFIVFLSFTLLFSTQNLKSVAYLLIYPTIVISFASISVYFYIKTANRATSIFSEVCNLRVFRDKKEGKVRSLKDYIRRRRNITYENLNNIRNPKSNITISEVVTGVPIPKDYTETKKSK